MICTIFLGRLICSFIVLGNLLRGIHLYILETLPSAFLCNVYPKEGFGLPPNLVQTDVTLEVSKLLKYYFTNMTVKHNKFVKPNYGMSLCKFRCITCFSHSYDHYQVRKR
jgi:hypothetical protein